MTPLCPTDPFEQSRTVASQQIAYLYTPEPGPGAKGPPSSSPCVQHRHQPQAGRLLLCCQRKRASHHQLYCSSAHPQCTMGFQSGPCVPARRGLGTSHRPASLSHCCPRLCSHPRLWAPVTRPTWHIPLIPPAGAPSFSLTIGRSAAPIFPQSKAPHSQCRCEHPSPAGTTCSSSSALHPLLHCLQLMGRAMAQPAACLRNTKSRLAQGWQVWSVDQQSCLNPSMNPGGLIRWLRTLWAARGGFWLSLLTRSDPPQATTVGPAGWPQCATRGRGVQSIPGKGQHSPCMKGKKHHKRNSRETNHR